MANPKEKLTFQGIDTAAFTGKVKSAWETYRKALEAAQKKIDPIMEPVKADRAKMEDLVVAQLRADGHLKQGQTVKFGYRFNTLAVAVTDEIGHSGSSKKIVLGSGR